MSRGTSFICEVHHADFAAGQRPAGHGAVAQAVLLVGEVHGGFVARAGGHGRGFGEAVAGHARGSGNAASRRAISSGEDAAPPR